MVEVSGKAKAHANFNRGTSSGGTTASLTFWKRVFARPPPQLAHIAPSVEAVTREAFPDEHGFGISPGGRAVVTAVPRRLAIFSRSSAESAAAWVFMMPLSSVL